MTTIRCADGMDLLMDYLEGTLPADVRAAVDAHVAGCERCVAFIRSYTETPRLLRDATACAVPPDLARSLMDALRAERHRHD